MAISVDSKKVKNLDDCVYLAESLVELGLGNRVYSGFTIVRWLEVLKSKDSTDLLLNAAVGCIAGFTNNYLRGMLGNASKCVAVQIVYLTDRETPE